MSIYHFSAPKSATISYLIISLKIFISTKLGQVHSPRILWADEL